jgi:hypothetical protein
MDPSSYVSPEYRRTCRYCVHAELPDAEPTLAGNREHLAALALADLLPETLADLRAELVESFSRRTE